MPGEFPRGPFIHHDIAQWKKRTIAPKQPSLILSGPMVMGRIPSSLVPPRCFRLCLFTCLLFGARADFAHSEGGGGVPESLASPRTRAVSFLSSRVWRGVKVLHPPPRAGPAPVDPRLFAISGIPNGLLSVQRCPVRPWEGCPAVCDSAWSIFPLFYYCTNRPVPPPVYLGLPVKTPSCGTKRGG